MMRAWFWFIVDTGWFLMTAAATVLACVSLVATPIWLGLIRSDLKVIRDKVEQDVTVIETCDCGDGCRCEKDRGPILPRVLPRLRNLREEAGE